MSDHDAAILSVDGTDRGKADRFELMLAALLGVTTLLIAFAALRASLLGDEVLKGYTESTQFYNDSSALDNADLQTFVQDQNLFLRYTEAIFKEDFEFATYMRENLFEPQLEEAVTWWEARLSEPNGPESPFEEGSPYRSPNADAVTAADAAAEASFEAGSAADDRGDKFDIATAILAVTLFSGGIASLLRSRNAQVLMVVVALTSLAVGAIYIAIGQFG